MAKTRTNSLSDKIRIARDKLVRAARAALMEATPIQALEAWLLVKGQELERNIPSLTPEQKQSLLQNLARELGADIIKTEGSELNHQQALSESDFVLPNSQTPAATPEPSKQPENLPNEAPSAEELPENALAVGRRVRTAVSPK